MLKGRTITSYYMQTNKIQEYINGSVTYMNQTELVIRQKLDEVVSYVKEIKGVDDSQVGYTYQLEGTVYKINMTYKNHKLRVIVDETGTVQGATAYILGLFPTKITDLNGTNVNNLALSQWSDILSK